MNFYFLVVCLITRYLPTYTQETNQLTSVARQMTICEGDDGSISCPERSVINVTGAYYGRMDRNRCPHVMVFSTNCRAPYSEENIKGRCDGKVSCKLSASNNAFGDPCRLTHKYLQVDYKCDDNYAVNKQKITCEGDVGMIYCPEGFVIQVTDAFYGRRDSITCPHDAIYNTNCRAQDAKYIIKERCNGQTTCELRSTNSVFGDPCVKTHKYLKVDYQCLEVVQRKHICEDSVGSINCPEGKSIHILDAYYGRMDSSICPHKIINTINCRAPNSMEKVKERCHTKATCMLNSTNLVFGDPCVNTHKYLQADYKCIE